MKPDLNIKDLMDKTSFNAGIKLPRKLKNEVIKHVETCLQDEIEGFKKNLVETFRPEKGQSTIKQIFNSVCNEFNVTPEEVLSSSQRHYIVKPRHVIRWLLHERNANTKFTLLQIAALTKSKRIGRNDHAAVINSITKVNNWMETDKEFKQRVELIIKELSCNESVELKDA